MNRTVAVAIVSVLLALTAAYVFLNPPERLALEGRSLAEFPRRLGSWESIDLSFSEVVYDELDADDTLARLYRNDVGDDVWFVIIFHQNERYGAHAPLVCYRSQGWEIRDEGLVRLAREAGDFDANWILVEKQGQQRLVFFWWYTAGDLATADRDKFMGRMAASGIVSNVTFGAFVRVSTEVIDGGVEEAARIARSFSESAMPHLPGLFSSGATEGADG